GGTTLKSGSGCPDPRRPSNQEREQDMEQGVWRRLSGAATPGGRRYVIRQNMCLLHLNICGVLYYACFGSRGKRNPTEGQENRRRLPWHPTRMTSASESRRRLIMGKAPNVRSLDGSASVFRSLSGCWSAVATPAPWLPSRTAVGRIPH